MLRLVRLLLRKEIWIGSRGVGVNFNNRYGVSHASLSAELLISIGGYRLNREMGARALLAFPVLSLSLEGTTKRGKEIN